MELHAFFVKVSLILATALWSFAEAQNGPTAWTTSPFPAPGLPLAVRSPYLNSWFPQGNNPYAVNEWWANLGCVDCPFTGWQAIVRVDGTAYRVAGDAAITNLTTGNQTAVEFTSTQTSFLFTTGPMQINLTYISPIEPTDLVRQSLPFTYLTMSAISTDGNAHTLQMYSDITGEWIAGEVSQLVQWSADDDDPYIVLQMSLQTQQKYTEINSVAQDATEYYAFKKINGANTSWAITQDLINRGMSVNGTTLLNSSDTTFRAVQDDWPTLGISVDWGSIKQTPEPAVWALGLIRSPSIQYRTSTGSVEDRYPYFLSTYADGNTAAKAFLDDFPRAQSAAQAFDAQIRADASAFSSDYADLVALSARQAIGTLDITLAKSGSGDFDMGDVKVFVKNMGRAGTDSAGTTSSVNTVDILYAAFPMYLYLNPEMGGYLLSPLLEYQDSNGYLMSYAAMNIGSSYPNATADGINESHNFGIEETSNMLIMTLAYSQRSGNGTLLSEHYSMLRGWAEYLESNALTPTNQYSVDFSAGSSLPNTNQTNLALKGIIGIACMAEIARIAGVSSDQNQFNSTAMSYISQWQSVVVASNNEYIDFIYGQPDTNGLIYNLYADKLLRLNLVSDLVYEILTSFYNNIAGQEAYGLPLDNSNSGRTMTNWMMFAASTVTNSTTQNFMTSLIREYASSSHNNTQFPTVYSPNTGVAGNVGSNSPASGAIYSLLALNTTIHSSITFPSDGSTDSGPNSASHHSKLGSIIGGAVGGGIALLLLIGLVRYYCLLRQTKLRLQQEEAAASVVKPYAEAEPPFFSYIPQLDGIDGRHRNVSEKGLAIRGSPSMRMSMRNGEGSSGLAANSSVGTEDLRWAVQLLARDRHDIAGAPPSYA